MPRKIAYGSFASTLGAALLLLSLLAFSAGTALAAPGAPPGLGSSAAPPPPYANPVPGTPQYGQALRPPAATEQAMASAPTGNLMLAVNYAHDWVCAYGAAAGTPLQFSVKRGSNVLATLNVNAEGNGYCSFQHQDWQPAQPNIEVGDSVTLTGGGATAAVNPVGEIAGTLDVATATVRGALHVPSLAPALLTVRCEVWVDGVNVEPIELQNVAANGGAYTCNFGAKGFVMQPGNDISVSYFQPDLNRVINVFRAPAPDLGIDMWSEGAPVARAGGEAVFHLRYQNHGAAPAPDVIVTDTLAENVTFVSDTAPVAPVATPGQVAWHLGELAPGAGGEFLVVLANTLPPGATLQNAVAINTSSTGDFPGDNQRTANIPVVSGGPDVRINPWARTRDALLGDSFVLNLDYGNNSQVPAGAVDLHLQLPQGTTLGHWESQNGFTKLWKVASNTGGEVVFEAPALPGNMGDQLLVWVTVAPNAGKDIELVSSASIEANGDINTANNGPFPSSVWTTDNQRPDLSVTKEWGYGVLAKDGPAWYQLRYSNDGNLTQASVRLTDTLPAGTHFVEATVDSNLGFFTVFPPAYQSGNVLAWDVGTLLPAQSGHLKIKVVLDGVSAGTTIANTATIAASPHDRSWWNNQASAVEKVNPGGPNLRIRQNVWWNGPGQVRFDVQFENLGTTVVDTVRIIETVPLGLEYNGNWGNNWWGDVSYSYDPANRQIVWTISRLEPTWAGGFTANFDVPQPDIGSQGKRYSNTAQITVPEGDVTPADNSSTAAAVTGPDLYVQQSVWPGSLAPGSLVRFAVEFGNHNNGPWWTGQPEPGKPGVLITDNLPPGLTFESATNPWDPGDGPWMPQQNGNQLIWGMPSLCSDCRFQFTVTARVGKAVRPGTSLTNALEISDVVPGDVDPVTDNNTASWTGQVRSTVYLPALRK